MTAAVERLEQPEYGHIWDRFHRRFQFRPGMSYSTWPAITEPTDSTTWSLSALDDDPGYLKLNTMVDAVNNGLRACTPPEGTLLILDWTIPATESNRTP